MKHEDEPAAYPAADYYYRRDLDIRELLPAVGAAVGAGLVTFYVARLLLQRTRLVPESGIAAVGRRGTIIRRPARAADD